MRPGLNRITSTEARSGRPRHLRQLQACSGRVLGHFAALYVTFYGFTGLRGNRPRRGRGSHASGNQIVAGNAKIASSTTPYIVALCKG